jgi:pentose-5-phosphate-3-epimerase
MLRGKPRGSTLGIERYQVQAREKARLSLISAIRDLHLESPNAIWTNIDVCRRAGLKSSVALKKSWNCDICQRIQQHNFTLKSFDKKAEEFGHLFSNSKCDKVRHLEHIIKKLRTELSLRTAELNAVMGQNRMLSSQLLRERKK